MTADNGDDHDGSAFDRDHVASASAAAANDQPSARRDAIAVMKPHIAYTHNEPCATLIRHFCDDLGRFTLKDDKGRHALRPFAMSYTILQYSTVLPFTFATFSNLF